MTRPEAPAIAATSLELQLPPDPQLLRVLRLIASGMASVAGLDLSATEDVRVAIDELGTILIGASDGSLIHLSVELNATTLCVEGRTTLPQGTELTVDPLADRLLGVVASAHSWTAQDGVASGRFEKNLRATS